MSRRSIVRMLSTVVAAGSLATLLLWGSYCLWFFAGENYRSAMPPVTAPDGMLQVVEGEGQRNDETFVLAAPGSRGEFLLVATLPEPFPAERVERIVASFSQTGSHHGLQLGVSQSETFLQSSESPVHWQDDQTAEVEAQMLFLKQALVHHLSIRIRGGMEPDFVLDALELHPARPTFAELQGLLFESLVDLSGWTQRSINHNRPDWTPLRLSPVPVIVAWIVLTTLLACAWLAWRGGLGRRRSLIVLAVSFGIGWLLLDLGWQVSLWQRHFGAVTQYGGLSPPEKRRTEIDGEIFAFIEDLKAELDDPKRRVVISGDSAFSHFRARYFAVPQSVISRQSLNGHWLRRMREGDVLALIHLRDSVEAHAVRMDGGAARLSRELALSEIAGRDAQLTSCNSAPDSWPCTGSFLELKEGEGPWIVQTEWLDDLPAGIWRLELELTGGGQAGWMRLGVLRRSTGQSPQRWAWREIFVPAAGRRIMTLAFRADQGAEYHLRLRELDARGMAVHSARLLPLDAGGDLVELSPDGSPPYFLARKLIEREGHVAWEML